MSIFCSSETALDHSRVVVARRKVRSAPQAIPSRIPGSSARVAETPTWNAPQVIPSGMPGLRAVMQVLSRARVACTPTWISPEAIPSGMPGLRSVGHALRSAHVAHTPTWRHRFEGNDLMIQCCLCLYRSTLQNYWHTGYL